MILAVLFLVYVIFNIIYKRNPKQFSKKLKSGATFAGIALIILLTVTGRLHWLFAIIASAIPYASRLVGILRILPLLQSARSALGMGGGAGKISQMHSQYLLIKLDHNSGKMKGEILQGDFIGNKLENMSLTDLIHLLAQYTQQDKDSALLLQAFLDRNYGLDWRHQFSGNSQTNNNASSSSMTKVEALNILGLENLATKKEIVKAHRKLMQRFHPDRGGSNYLAAKINAAKELLLDK